MHTDVGDALSLIFAGIERLQSCCKDGRRFTIDGRLVGDVGELIAARDFDIRLDATSRALHDGCLGSDENRLVQVKATFKDHLSFGREPMLYLGLKLHADGSYDVIFNGPGSVIAEAYRHRQGIGQTLLGFPVASLRELSKSVSDFGRVPRRVLRQSPGSTTGNHRDPM